MEQYLSNETELTPVDEMKNQDNLSDNENLDMIYMIDEQKIISINKFIFLTIISLGLYQIWWIYKAWKFFKQKEELNINPALHAVFSIFFLIPLFNKILHFAKEKGYNNSYSSILLFVGFWIVNYFVYLPAPFFLIAVSCFVFLVLPFHALNFAKQNSTDFIVIEQTSYSKRQIALIVVGAIFWVLLIIGLIIPDNIEIKP